MGIRSVAVAATTLLLSVLLVVAAVGARPLPRAGPGDRAGGALATSDDAGTSEAVPAIAVEAAVEPDAVVTVNAALPAAEVGPMKHVWQTINNCGPAAVVMALSTLGIDAAQEEARIALRGTDERRGMGPSPVGPWVQQKFGLRSMWRNNGTNDLMKRLISNGFAPMVTQWMQDPWISRISHWRIVRGYDDARGVFYVNDPMLGRGVPLRYDWFGDNWLPFSYRYLVVYRPEDESKLRTIVAEDWNDARMRQRYYARAKDEASTRDTAAAWLAYGEASYQYGLFAEAVAAFEKGLAIGSPTGVFTLRSSYANALRALGRHKEAEVVQARLANITPGVAVVAGTPDPRIIALAEEREREALARAPRYDGVRFTD